MPRFLVLILALLGLAVRAQAVQEAPQDETSGLRAVRIGHREGNTGTLGYARRHAVVVGIDQYQDPDIPDLSYAAADAKAVAQILIERFGFATGDVRMLVDGQATRQALNEALESVTDSRKDDLVVVFFAGHGVTRTAGGGSRRGYLVPTDATQDPVDGFQWASLLGMNDIQDVCEFIPAKHALFILDCCFGGLVGNYRSTAAPLSGISNRARQGFTAGNADQPVLDTGPGGHSVFTAALLQGLRGDADVDLDQVVTSMELFRFVAWEVEQRTRGKQTPAQFTLPDHGGGWVSLFPPDLDQGPRQSPTELLRNLRQSHEEKLEELQGYADARRVAKLAERAATLWPCWPDRVADMNEWCDDADLMLECLPRHRESLLRVRRTAYAEQDLAGGMAQEIDWDAADPELAWRFDTLADLERCLEDLEAERRDVEQRRLAAGRIWQRSIGDHQDIWEEVVNDVALGERYDGLEMAPQVGLVPLGLDQGSGLWEFWHVESGERPVRDPVSDRWLITADTGMVFVLVPGGEAWVGAQSEDPAGRHHDPDALLDETPHAVNLAPFFLSKYEMTQAQWRRVMGSNPSGNSVDEDFVGAAAGFHPVEQVSHEDCVIALGHLGLQLPTEVQWEYAARAGSEMPWCLSADEFGLRTAGNLRDQSCVGRFNLRYTLGHRWTDSYAAHAPVGRFDPNAWGFHDVIGNVWEWCWDDYVEAWAEHPRRAEDGRAEAEGTRLRVCRGGSFNDTANLARSSNRNYYPPAYRDDDLGLRPARAILPAATGH